MSSVPHIPAITHRTWVGCTGYSTLEDIRRRDQRRSLSYRDSITRWILFMVLKTKINTFLWALMVFTILGCISVRKSKVKFLPGSMKSLTDYENLFSNSIQKACSGFPIAACDFKNSPESRLWSWNCSESRPCYTLSRTKEKIDRWKGRKAGTEILMQFS